MTKNATRHFRWTLRLASVHPKVLFDNTRAYTMRYGIGGAKREELFSLLEMHFLPGTDLGVGRPGMNMWRIHVLAGLKQSLGCDFDRLQELANKHASVR